MEENPVWLKLTIKYKEKEVVKDTNEFINFEGLKNISKEEFNIPPNEFVKKLKFKLNKEEKYINNDADIISGMVEKDDFNYILDLDLVYDKKLNEAIKEGLNKINKVILNLCDKKKKKLFYFTVFINSIKLKKDFEKVKLEFEKRKKEIDDGIINYKKYEEKPKKEILLEINKNIYIEYKGEVKPYNKLNEGNLEPKLGDKGKNNEIEKDFINKKRNEFMEKINKLFQDNFDNCKSEIKTLIQNHKKVGGNNKNNNKNNIEQKLQLILGEIKEIKKITNDLKKREMNAQGQNGDYKNDYGRGSDTPLNSRNFKG